MPEQIVSVTVKSKEELDEDFKVSLDVPAFKSKFPTIVYLKPEDAAKIKTGQAYNFRLEQGKLSEGKDGGQPWHYRWKFLSLSSGAPAPSLSSPPSPAPQGAPRPVVAQEAGYDARGASIERQVALKAAVEIAVAHIAKGDGMPSANIVQVAGYFARFLATGSAPAPRVVEPEPREEDMEEELFGEEKAA